MNYGSFWLGGIQFPSIRSMLTTESGIEGSDATISSSETHDVDYVLFAANRGYNMCSLYHFLLLRSCPLYIFGLNNLNSFKHLWSRINQSYS